MTNQYAKVEPIINDDDQLEDVHLDVLGVKLDLPNLNSADLPIDLVNVILLIKSQPVLSDEQTALAMSAFLAYFQQLRPDYWNALRKTGHAMAWLTATVRTWAEQSSTQKRLPQCPPRQSQGSVRRRLARHIPHHMEARHARRMAQRARGQETQSQLRHRPGMAAHETDPQEPYQPLFRGARRLDVHAHRGRNRHVGHVRTRRQAATRRLATLDGQARGPVRADAIGNQPSA